MNFPIHTDPKILNNGVFIYHFHQRLFVFQQEDLLRDMQKCFINLKVEEDKKETVTQRERCVHEAQHFLLFFILLCGSFYFVLCVYMSLQWKRNENYSVALIQRLFILVRTVLISDVQSFLISQRSSVRLLKLAGWRKLLQKGKKEL